MIPRNPAPVQHVTGGSVLVVIAVIFVAAILVTSAALMISTAMVHRDVPAVPALGFVASLGLAILTATLGTLLKGVTGAVTTK